MESFGSLRATQKTVRPDAVLSLSKEPGPLARLRFEAQINEARLSSVVHRTFIEDLETTGVPQ